MTESRGTVASDPGSRRDFPAVSRGVMTRVCSVSFRCSPSLTHAKEMAKHPRETARRKTLMIIARPREQSQEERARILQRTLMTRDDTVGSLRAPDAKF